MVESLPYPYDELEALNTSAKLHEVKGTSSPQFITKNLILKAFRLGKQIKESVGPQISTNRYIHTLCTKQLQQN